MSRKQRLHLEGGFYYVCLQRSSENPPLFTAADEYTLFNALFAEAVAASGAQVHGYLWQTRAVHCIVEAGELPVGELMRLAMSKYVHRVRFHRELRNGTSIPRYRAMLFDQYAYLLKLLRYLHCWLPHQDPDIETPDEYPWCSDPAYRGARAVTWLTTRTALGLLSERFDCARTRYADFMQRSGAADVESIEHGSTPDGRVLGDQYFICRLPLDWPIHHSKLTLKDVATTVCAHFEVEPGELFCRSQTSPKLAMVRAIVAWHAKQRGIATIAAAARHFGKTPPTLHAALTRYQQRHPELFSLTAIRRTVPIVSPAVLAQLSGKSTPAERPGAVTVLTPRAAQAAHRTH